MQRPQVPAWKRATVVVVAVLSAGWLASLTSVMIWEVRDTAGPADAIVVLGAAQYAGRPSPVLRARLDHAIALWRQGLASQLIVTGGTGEGDTTSEAAVSRWYAIGHGVPDSAIVLEANGRTTAQSIQTVAALLLAEGRSRVVLVSDPFHMLRLNVLARKAGLVPLLSPTRSSPISTSTRERWAYRLSESVKVPAALLTGT